MQIWTTPYLNSQLSLKELPVRLISDKEIKRTVLEAAGPDDIVILALDDGYLDFLQRTKERGMAGPILLISPEPTMLEEDLQAYNALVLDLKKMGGAVVNNIVRFIEVIALHYYTARAPVAPLDHLQLPDAAADRPIENPASILARLTYAIANSAPVIAAIEVREAGEPVTTRGACAFKGFEGETLVLDRFKHALLLRSLKPGMPITLFFPYKQKDHGAVVIVEKVTDSEVRTSLPARLFPNREMRIQPSQARPVTLYLLIPNEPTLPLPVFDISPRGIGFLCTRDLPVNGIYSLTLVLPDPQAVVLTSGIIRFKRESSRGIRYGAEIQPHPWDSDAIAKYLMKRETEILNLLRGS